MEELSASHLEDIKQNINIQKDSSEYNPMKNKFDVLNKNTEEQNTDIQLAYELDPDTPKELAKSLEALVDNARPDEYA